MADDKVEYFFSLTGFKLSGYNFAQMLRGEEWKTSFD